MELKMEVKKWGEYSHPEKVALLKHFYTYYGKSIMDFAELTTMYELIEVEPDMMWKVVVMSLYCDFNPQTVIIQCIRDNSLDGLRSSLPGENVSPEFQEIFTHNETSIIMQAVESFNNPQPPNPITMEQAEELAARIFS